MLLEAACLLVMLVDVNGDGWRWPDNTRAASVRIDTKVRFVDDERRSNKLQADEIKPPVETEGFYNRPTTGAGSGRYSVSSEPHSQRLAAHDLEAMKLIRGQYSDGTLDSVQYCKCVVTSTSTCHSRGNSEKACPSGQSLCCYKRPNRNLHSSDSGIFSELDDERPMLLPSHERSPGPFTDPEEVLHGGLKSIVNGYQNGGDYRSLLFGPGGPTGIIGPGRRENRVLVGPSGPTGQIGPELNKQVLVGPNGPTGIIGPNHRGSRYQDINTPGVLVGPEGPTGAIGPNHGDSRYPGRNQRGRNPGVLVGPDGPSGVIGPNDNNRIPLGPNRRNPEVVIGPNKQVLVGPGGPTGVVGPNHRGSRYQDQHNPAVLVGPEGPTGVIGPNDHENSVLAGHDSRYPGALVTDVIRPGHRDDRNFNGATGYPGQYPDVLVGPEGPTGHIGPNHRAPHVLVGPGGPTGGIGPDLKQGVSHGAESAQVLVGPGGPTGIIGPGGRRGRWQTGPGILVGPGGPTGIIGPGQRLLVGPGGPTGLIGPRGGRGYGCPKRKAKARPRKKPKYVYDD